MPNVDATLPAIKWLFYDSFIHRVVFLEFNLRI